MAHWLGVTDMNLLTAVVFFFGAMIYWALTKIEEHLRTIINIVTQASQPNRP
jgi:hypothetical protein